MSIHDLQTLPAKFENMADKENGFVIGFFEEFLDKKNTCRQIRATLLYQNAIAGRIITSAISLRGKRSRGKGKAIRARDRTRGRRGTPARKPLFSPFRPLIKKITKITQLVND